MKLLIFASLGTEFHGHQQEVLGSPHAKSEANITRNGVEKYFYVDQNENHQKFVKLFIPFSHRKSCS